MNFASERTIAEKADVIAIGAGVAKVMRDVAYVLRCDRPKARFNTIIDIDPLTAERAVIARRRCKGPTRRIAE